MDTATFLVDRDARVMYANIHAQHLLLRDSRVMVREGRLTLERKESAAKLLSHIAQQLHTEVDASRESGVFCIAKTISNAPLTARVASMSPLTTDDPLVVPSRAALVLIRSHDAPLASSKSLRALFGLTQKESDIAAALANGQSLEQAAASLTIAIGTARTHLKSCMTKTGTSRQAQLVSRILLGAWLPP
jgi:DNA-binding CsgD family transcriptional regulator